MIIEYLFLQDNLKFLCKLDLSKIDKLFVNVQTKYNKYFDIYLFKQKWFNQLDPDKIIFLSIEVPTENTVKYCDEALIKIEQWKGLIITVGHSYQYQKYNFIFSKMCESVIISQLKAKKINIILALETFFAIINDEIRAINPQNFIDIIIYPKHYKYNRYKICLTYGITDVTRTHKNSKFIQNPFKWIELIGNKVYLKF